MRYTSTRPGPAGAGPTAGPCTSAEAIFRGLSQGGGLFVPDTFPSLTLQQITRLSGLPYWERAAYVLRLYLTDYPEGLVEGYCEAAYGPSSRFDAAGCAPVRALDPTTSCLELWHGPTCAFKDIALQMLPRLLTGAMSLVGGGAEVAILVATSGDTGKAALEGFADVPGTRILVFYPDGGVSEVQEAQMLTQAGANVGVAAVRGNFDDTQTGVKRIFTDAALAARAASRGLALSSANSINWGRLVPQVVYYLSAYADMVQAGTVRPGSPVNIVVPTGNFGNILAAYYAYRMGLPVHRLICASNVNNVLTDFLATGTYDRRREFARTSSPSMDILISSNLERLLFEISGRGQARVAGWMAQLEAHGAYSLGVGASDLPDPGTPLEAAVVAGAIPELFWGCWASEADTLSSLSAVWQDHGYLIDTHTAVGFHALRRYRETTGDHTPTLVVSTASPFKFSGDVARAVLGEAETLAIAAEQGEFEVMRALAAYTGVPVPTPLLGLEGATPLHSLTCGPQGMAGVVEGFLGL